MDRPPRNAQTDRLVNFRLISFAYLQIGMIQALAGFFVYIIVLNDYGYAPNILMGNGLEWTESSLLCTLNGDTVVDTTRTKGYYRPKECGFGCADDKTTAMAGVCTGGCSIPVGYLNNSRINPGYSAFHTELAANSSIPGAFDPFLEFDADGFRGEGNTCSRSCSDYTANQDNYGAAGSTERQMMTHMCGLTGSADWGFSRAYVDKGAIAPKGAYYWWNGAPQTHPNPDYQTAALEYAQTAYFITIIIVQWADLMIAKTRKLSIFEQGMGNDFMNFGLIFETVLGATLCYTPIFNQVFGTRPLHILHWFSGLPWSILIFSYDELRKSFIRSNPKGWLDRWTYW